MAYYLGIDGGGTKTRCALGDEHRVVATTVTGACNVVRVGVASARHALHGAIRQVCQPAAIAPKDISNICIGAAGAAREEVANQIRDILGEVTPARVEVVGDTIIALEAAFGSGPGIIAISGTGSIIYGRNSRGETARAGGWGYAISDEGSAQWIGRRAVWTILRALDQGAETMLTAQVLNAWNLHSLEELVQQANSAPPPEFPTLFPVVLRTAHEGDAMARALLADAAAQLAEQTAIVVRRLFPKVDEHARIAMTGSVFRQSSDVRQVFYTQVRALFPSVDIRNELVEPVDGALSRARRQHSALGA